jgi:hypothetical protein
MQRAIGPLSLRRDAQSHQYVAVATSQRTENDLETGILNPQRRCVAGYQGERKHQELVGHGIEERPISLIWSRGEDAGFNWSCDSDILYEEYGSI